MSQLSSPCPPYGPLRTEHVARDRVRVMTRRLCGGFGGALALLLAVTKADAQALNYPSLQVPTASTRDYTGALSGGDGTTLLFQWREGWTARRHLQLDVGIADRKGSESLLMLIGGAFGQELLRASGDQPLDLLFTGGVGMSFGDGVSLLRVPIGLSIGHTFDLDDGMSLTPYVHPRASIDVCSNCGNRSGICSPWPMRSRYGSSSGWHPSAVSNRWPVVFRPSFLAWRNSFTNSGIRSL